MRSVRVAILGISWLLLSGFASTNWITVSDYCQNYSIIHPSRKDTPDTLRQVERENAKWRSLCEVKK